jgi:Ran GTPase-activating protein (RanGAP) involved in mRNA processing and transport
MNVLANHIPNEQALALIEVMQLHTTLRTLCGIEGAETELDFSKTSLGDGCAVLLSHELKDHQALTKLDLSGNSIAGLCGEPGVVAIADTLRSKSTLLSELSLAQNNLDAECLGILLPAICSNHTVTSLNLLGNNFPLERVPELIRTMESHTTLTTLCGIKGDETELDFFKKRLGDGCAALLSNELKDHRTLTSLHVGCNGISEDKMQAIIDTDRLHVLCAVPVKDLRDNAVTELDLAGRSLGVEGALVLSNCLMNNSSLTSLNISRNELQYTLKKGAIYEHTEPNSDGVDALCRVLRTKAVPALSKFTFDGNRSSSLEVALEVGMAKADVSGKMLTEEGARVAGAFLSRCPAPVSIVCGDLPELVFNGSSVTKFGIASWGMKLNASLALRSPVKVVSSIPPTAKSGIVNADEVKGMVVLVDRDMGCKFVDTAKMAVAAGAVAVIIANNDAEKGDAYFAPGGETDSSCPIPVVMISFSAAVAMRNAPAMHVELLYPGLHVDTTHANFSGKTLGSGGGKLVASLVRNSRVLSKVTCGGAKRWQKRSMCDGASFDVGKAVQCLGLQCIVTKPVDSRGDLKIQYPTAVLECSMTEIDLSGLYFRFCDLMIVTAFISSKCQ